MKLALADILPVIEEKADRLDWEEFGSGVYVAPLPNGFFIEANQLYDQGIALLDANMRRLEEVKALRGDPEAEASRRVQAIVEIARRKALAVDDAVLDTKRVFEAL